jgi:hypothetical protein
MLSKYAKDDALNPSGAHHKFLKWGQSPAPFGEGRPEAALIMCSASIRKLGLRIFQKIWPRIL